MSNTTQTYTQQRTAATRGEEVRNPKVPSLDTLIAEEMSERLEAARASDEARHAALCEKARLEARLKAHRNEVMQDDKEVEALYAAARSAAADWDAEARSAAADWDAAARSAAAEEEYRYSREEIAHDARKEEQDSWQNWCNASKQWSDALKLEAPPLTTKQQDLLKDAIYAGNGTPAPSLTTELLLNEILSPEEQIAILLKETAPKKDSLGSLGGDLLDGDLLGSLDGDLEYLEDLEDLEEDLEDLEELETRSDMIRRVLGNATPPPSAKVEPTKLDTILDKLIKKEDERRAKNDAELRDFLTGLV